jgi:hypothetical protein
MMENHRESRQLLLPVTTISRRICSIRILLGKPEYLGMSMLLLLTWQVRWRQLEY